MSIRLTHPTNRPNFTCLELSGLALWFSYETVIAFESDKLYVSENCWGPTTGKHINYVSNGERLPRKEFEKRLNEYLPFSLV